jgi:hypothetical protein
MLWPRGQSRAVIPRLTKLVIRHRIG